jgi:hypothetical protein
MTNLALLVVNHDIVRLDISVHDALAVTEVERLEQLVDIETNVVVGEPRVERPEIGVVDSLKDKTGSFALIVADHIQQCHYIRTTGKVLQNLDLTLDLLLLDRLENLDDTLLIVDNVDAFENFGVLSTT